MYAVPKSPKILITGFKPFLGAEANPSEFLAQEISKNNTAIEVLILPVEFGNSFELVSARLATKEFDQVIMLGQAAGRSKVGLEKIGLNWVQTEHPDEAGIHPLTGAIYKHQPLALMSTFAIDEFFSILKGEGHSVEVSFSAGSFVCNDLYFRVLCQYPDLKSVFVHVPLVLDLPLQQQLATIRRLISISEQLSGQ